MAIQKYAVRDGSYKELEFERKSLSNKYHVRLNGQEIALVPTKTFRKVWTYKLSRGVLTVRHGQGLSNSRLDVRFNDQPLEGSANDPGYHLEQSYKIIFFIAAINLIFGVLGLFSPGLSGFVVSGLYAIITGVIYSVLGYFAMRRSYIALGIASFGFGLDTLLILIDVLTSMSRGDTYAGGALPSVFMRGFFLAFIVRGILAVRKLKQQEQRPYIAPDLPVDDSEDAVFESFFQLDEIAKPTVKEKEPTEKPGVKLSQTEMILIGVLVTMVIVVVGLIALVATRKVSTQTAALPTLAYSATLGPTATPTPIPTPTATPYPYGTLLKIPMDVIDATYSPALKRMVAIVNDHDLMENDVLHLYDPLTHSDNTIILCRNNPQNVVVDPAGQYAVLGYYGGACVIDLQNQKLLGNIQIVDRHLIVNQILTDAGWLYYSLKLENSNMSGLYAINIHYPNPKENYNTIQVRSPINKIENFVYSNTYDFQVTRWDVTSGPVGEPIIWEFPHERFWCGNVWVSADSQYMFNGCGAVYTLHTDASLPTYQSELISREAFVDDQPVKISDMVESVASGRLVVIGTHNSSYARCNDTVFIFDRTTFQWQGEYPLPSEWPCGTKVFIDNDGLHYYILFNEPDNEYNGTFIIGDFTSLPPPAPPT